MGVKDLWTILEPSAERVNLDALSGKTIAVDASIWMIQFLKAMRDESGEPIPFAHILGFLKRIIKLLHLRVFPVFVFDGKTPTIKRRTVRERKRKSLEAKLTLRKAAETILMNAIEREILEKQLEKRVERDMDRDEKFFKEKMEEMMMKIASNGTDHGKDGFVAALGENGNKDDDEDDEQQQDAFGKGKEKKKKRKFIDPEEEEDEEEEEEEKKEESETDPDEDFSAWDVEIPTDEDGKIDPTVLGALPVSMQLEMMKRIREENVGKNRSQFQAFEKDSKSFSQLQIEKYLESTKLRKEMDRAMRQNGAKSGGNNHQAGDVAKKIAAHDGVEYVYHKRGNDGGGDGGGGGVNSAGFRGSSIGGNTSGNNKILPNGQTRDLLEDSYRGFASFQAGQTKLLNNRPQVQSFYQEKKRRKGQQDLSAPRTDLIISSALNEHLPGPTIARSVAEMPHRAAVNKNKDSSKNEHLSTEVRIQISKKELEDMKTVDPLFAEEGDAVKEEDEEEEEEWEDVEDDEDARHLKIVERVLEEKSKQKKEENEHFEEEPIGSGGGGSAMKTRKDVYSMTHGFVRGKSLEEWQSDEEKEEEEKEEEEEEPTKALPAPTPVEVEVKDEECIEIASSSSDDEDKVDNVDIKKAEETKDVVSDEAADEEEYNNIDVDSEDDEGALQRAIFLSLERDNPGRVGRGLRYRPKGNDDERDTYEDVKKAADEAKISSEEKKENEEAAEKAKLEKADEEKQKKQKMVTFLEEEEEEEEGEEKKLPKASSASLPPPRQPTSYQPSSFQTDTPENEFFRNFRIKSDVEDEIEREMDADDDLFANAAKEMEDEERRKKINTMIEENERERQILEEKRKKAQKIYGEQPTPQMFREVQELLMLLGIPYVVAPEEAEAECAHLNRTGKVDGVFTNDSDVFLFGATLVFRNAFENTKAIQMYKSSRIEKQLGLNRERMIQLAMLLGSDYTIGIDGIGIVNAMEVLAGFSDADNEKGVESLEGLKQFKKWTENQTLSLPGAKGAKVRKHLEKVKSEEEKTQIEDKGDSLALVVVPDDHEARKKLDDDAGETTANDENVSAARKRFYQEHQTKKTTWKFPPSFPDEAVRVAYAEPKVDPSEEDFVWDQTPLERDILDFFRERLNWPEDFTSDTLRPMYDKIKERNEKYKQKTMQDYFESLVQKSDGFTKIKSKRLAMAVADLKGEDFDASIVFPDKRPGAPSKKREKKKTAGNDIEGDNSDDDDEDAVTEKVPSPLKLAAASPRKKKNEKSKVAPPAKKKEKAAVPKKTSAKKKTVAKKT